MVGIRRKFKKPEKEKQCSAKEREGYKERAKNKNKYVPRKKERM